MTGQAGRPAKNSKQGWLVCLFVCLFIYLFFVKIGKDTFGFFLRKVASGGALFFRVYFIHYVFFFRWYLKLI